MKIYDAISKRELSQVTLYLTPSEAAELGDTAHALAVDPKQHHGHVTDVDLTREVILAVYTADNLSQFDAESRSVLAEDDVPRGG